MPGMTAADLFRIQSVSDAQISPDGRRVAFVVTRLDEEADDYRSQVWMVETAAAEGVAPFTTGKGKDSAPRWSPDGTRLAFLSDRDGGKPQVYVIPAGGGEARKLTSIPQGAGAPVWSPDGRRLLSVVRTGGDEGTEEKDKPKNPPARVITTLKHKGNGEGFTYDRRRHLFVVDAETGDTRQLTDGDWDDTEPAWAPDSRRVAFVSVRHEERDYIRANDIFVVDAGDGPPGPPSLEGDRTAQADTAEGVPEAVRITPDDLHVSTPAWSPDGATIAFLGYAGAEDAPRNDRLWLMAGDGGAAPRCLTTALDRQLDGSDAPVWSADGQTITLSVQDRGTVGVIAVAVADGAVSRLVGGRCTVTSYSCAGGAVAFSASDATHPAEVFMVDAAGERKLTDLNAAWRAGVELVQPERYTVQSGGIDIDCWVMRPAGYEPGKKYPALLNIHGGPFAQYGEGFFDEFQVQAGAGHAVVYCNPRGSSGREDAFSRAIISDPAVPMSADVLAALDEALRRWDFIDAERTGVLGGSYGGYITAWIIGETDRFAAACAERGVYNRYSREGTGDIPTAFTYLRVRAWEEPETYWRHSPLSRARQMRTPLLIVHSEQDLRCPIEQAEQLFTVLKQQRRDVRFVRFPGENHELSRAGKPSHRVQRFEHILGWFGEKLAAAARVEAAAAGDGG